MPPPVPVCSCALFAPFCTRDRGCGEHPAFPAPSNSGANGFSKPPAHRAAGSWRHIQWSSPGLTGRPSIREMPMIKPKSRGVLDTRFRGYDSAACGGTTTSLRAPRATHPSVCVVTMDCFVAVAPRNDDSSTRNSSQRIAFAQTAPASEWRLRLRSALDVHGWAAKPPT
jgi:hypothetical protein